MSERPAAAVETNPFRLQNQETGTTIAGGSAGEGAPAAPAGGSSPGVLGRAHAWTRTSVAGKSWWVRAPLLIPLLWIFRGYLGDRMYHSMFDGLTLGFHEAGHAAFMWFGNNLLTTAGGTLFQLGIPLAAALYLLLKQRDPFGATVGTFWMGTAFVGAGVYAADARAQDLPLVSPFGPVDPLSHDWTVMLMKFGKLTKDQEIGAALASTGIVTMALSLAVAVWVLRVMATTGAPAAGMVGTRERPAAAAAGGSDRRVKLQSSAGEEERLGAFLSGKPVERVPPKRIFKRSRDASAPAGQERAPAAPSPTTSGPRRGAPIPPRPATSAPGEDAHIARPTPGTTPSLTEEERFLEFLERNRKGRS